MTTLFTGAAPAVGPFIASNEAVNHTYQATVYGTGTVAATVVIEGSNDGIGGVPLGTITLSGTTKASDGFTTNASWDFVRATVSSISGTGALVICTKGGIK